MLLAQDSDHGRLAGVLDGCCYNPHSAFSGAETPGRLSQIVLMLLPSSMRCKVIKKKKPPWHHRGPPGPPALRPKNDPRPNKKPLILDLVHTKLGPADMDMAETASLPAVFVRQLARFEHVSLFTSPMRTAAALGIALTGHETILDGGLA